MKKLVQGILIVALLLGSTAVAPPRAELMEEIVAWVNGDIITRSELEDEEQMMIAEAYRRYTGEELDTAVANLRSTMLLDMVDRKILIHKASLLYDVERMKEVYYDLFRDNQNITDEAELERSLAQDGLTIEKLKQRLLELYAPDEVIRFEVGAKVGVSDKEVESFYAENPERFEVPPEATLSEIVLKADSEAKLEERRPELDAILARIAAGEEFADVARELSEAGTAPEGGSLGVIKKGDLSEQLEQLAFNAPVGEVADPLEMPYGFHLVKVESRNDTGRRDLEDVREQLRSWLEDRKYTEELRTFKIKIRDEAEWCVKPKYRSRLVEDYSGQVCENI